MGSKLETGIETLDRQLGGGLPKGSITVLEAPPGSQGHLFLHELTDTRGTLWLSFARAVEAIERSLAETPSNSGECTVKHVSSTNPMDDAEKWLDAVPRESNIILDPTNVLESEESHKEYWTFLNELQTYLLDKDSLAVLYCTKGVAEVPLRDMTKYFADVVLELETKSVKGDVENFLHVPKYRRGECPSGVLKLELQRGVSIDTSRDIA